MKTIKMITILTAACVLASAGQALAQANRTQQPTAPASEGVVNINTATAEQLTYLPGVGPSRARAIIAARDQRPFRAVRELQRVRGIGWATVQRLRPYLTVSGETTLSQAVPMRSSRSD